MQNLAMPEGPAEAVKLSNHKWVPSNSCWRMTENDAVRPSVCQVDSKRFAAVMQRSCAADKSHRHYAVTHL